MKPSHVLHLVLVATAVAGCASTRDESGETAVAALRTAAASLPPATAPDTAPATAAAPETFDAVRVRSDLLARMDAAVEAQATLGHLRARLLLDEAIPVAYLGIDADPDGGGMRVTKVFPDTGAERAGVRVGNLLLAVDDDVTDAGIALGRSIRKHKPGDVLTVSIRRGTGEVRLPATLGRRPEEDEDEDEQFPELRTADGRAPPAVTYSFDDAVAGAEHGAFEAVLGGHGRPPLWRVHAEGGDKFLRQEDDDATGIRFPMALLRGAEMSDGTVSARFRLTGGRQDKAAGLVLRWRDPGNYLVARVNSTENDLRIFRVVNGRRRTLPGGRVEVRSMDDGRWHDLTFTADGAKVTASVDGGVPAVSWDTYFLRGRVGTWTKSDAISDFDDVRFAPTR